MECIRNQPTHSSFHGTSRILSQPNASGLFLSHSPFLSPSTAPSKTVVSSPSHILLYITSEVFYSPWFFWVPLRCLFLFAQFISCICLQLRISTTSVVCLIRSHTVHVLFYCAIAHIRSWSPTMFAPNPLCPSPSPFNSIPLGPHILRNAILAFLPPSASRSSPLPDT